MTKLEYEPRQAVESLGRHVLKRVLAGMLILAMGLLTLVCIGVGTFNLGAVLDGSHDRIERLTLTVVPLGFSAMLLLLILRWGRYCLTGSRYPRDQTTVREFVDEVDTSAGS